jgi:hypothetical protein
MELKEEITMEVSPVTMAKLEKKLKRLKNVSRKGLELSLVWQPNKGGPLSGEVKGKTVYIYEADEEKALDILEHEFVDYLVTTASEFYKMLSKSLMKVINEMAYLHKEEIVESLLALLNEEEGEEPTE